MAEIPLRSPWWRRAWKPARDTLSWVWFATLNFFASRPPRFRYAVIPLVILSVILFIRHPATNYIFDEQEALLANPYVNGMNGLSYGDAIHRDFWGLPPTASIGSYRPIPNFYWRALWTITKHPFWHHLLNLVVHGVSGAMLGSFAFALTRRRLVGWLTGLLFVACAVITEAVSGLVGIADVLGGLGAVLALSALRLPGRAMPLGIFIALLLGLFSKESALVCVPLVPVVALMTAPLLHPQRPARLMRALLAAAASLGAFVLYVELRKQWFGSPLPEALSEPLAPGVHWMKRAFVDFMVWFHQAPLPKDPLNNPLAEADFPHRVSGALRVFWRGLGQVVFPWTLSGDYSFPQEPIPKSLYAWESVAGGLAMIGPFLAALPLMFLAWWRERRDGRQLLRDATLSDALRSIDATAGWRRMTSPMLAAPAHGFRRRWMIIGSFVAIGGLSALAMEVGMKLGGAPSWVHTWPVSLFVFVIGVGFLVDGWRSASRAKLPAGPWPWRHIVPVFLVCGSLWIVVSYFPHSNIPAVLPTVRAERFWYFPAMGSSWILALFFAYLIDRFGHLSLWRLRPAVACLVLFVVFQTVQAYRHSMDYYNDLAFWKATKDAVPRSAKAHLNYSVMTGARGDLKTRLAESKIALELAPKWPMANIYTGDTLCRMKRAAEAWPYYEKGFAVGPNERSLIALALQCMYDEKILLEHDTALRALADKNPGSWIAYLAVDTLNNHESHKGVDPQYRPRGYNEGPKDEEKSGSAEASASAQEDDDLELVSAEPAQSTAASTGSAAASTGSAAASGAMGSAAVSIE